VQPSVWAHEPHSALFSGEDGLDLYHTLLSQIAQKQKKLRYLFCEIGHNQGAAFLGLAAKLLPPHSAQLKKDLAGFDRIIKIELNSYIS
jgi:release factor glutamine methyltransferase